VFGATFPLTSGDKVAGTARGCAGEPPGATLGGCDGVWAFEGLFVGEAVEKVRGERGEEGQAEEVADSIRNGRQELSSRLCEGATGMGH